MLLLTSFIARLGTFHTESLRLHWGHVSFGDLRFFTIHIRRGAYQVHTLGGQHWVYKYKGKYSLANMQNTDDRKIVQSIQVLQLSGDILGGSPLAMSACYKHW